MERWAQFEVLIREYGWTPEYVKDLTVTERKFWLGRALYRASRMAEQ